MLFCAISDTHNQHSQLTIPNTDGIIHCGDSCTKGTKAELYDFIDWYAALPQQHKIVVFGNHDRYAYDNIFTVDRLCADKGITVLLNTAVRIGDVNIFGTPWSRAYGWTKAFMYPPSDEHRIWTDLREYTNRIDILVTHTPPYGVLDKCPDSVGSEELALLIPVIRPKYHLFGHVHEGHGGVRHAQWPDMAETYMANVSRVTWEHTPVRDPIFVFEV